MLLDSDSGVVGTDSTSPTNGALSSAAETMVGIMPHSVAVLPTVVEQVLGIAFQLLCSTNGLRKNAEVNLELAGRWYKDSYRKTK